MIPKKIHYCWFGEAKFSELEKKCIESWRSFFPDWEIILWNEKNSPMDLPYMKNAYKNKKWANLSNLTRLYALIEYGGIYFDTDIEVVKKFDDILECNCFLGFQTKTINDNCVNDAVIGSNKKNVFIKELYDKILDSYDGTEEAYLSSPYITSMLLLNKGLKEYKNQCIDNVSLFTQDYFYPYSWNEPFSFSSIKQNTRTIHYWNLSWKDEVSEIKVLTNENEYLKSIIANLYSGRIPFFRLFEINKYFLLKYFKRNKSK